MCRGAARGCLGWHTSARHALSATHTGCRLATETMKKAALLLMPLLCVAYLYTGYYETRWAEDNRMVLFIKQKLFRIVPFVSVSALQLTKLSAIRSQALAKFRDLDGVAYFSKLQ